MSYQVNPNSWRPTRSCTASGHAPAAQNCPRSRTRLTTWLQRFSGAANAAGASEAGGWKRDLENASLSRNLRAAVRSRFWNRNAAPRVLLVRRESKAKGAWWACVYLEPLSLNTRYKHHGNASTHASTVTLGEPEKTPCQQTGSQSDDGRVVRDGFANGRKAAGGK
jgi:hypothetical protein